MLFRSNTFPLLGKIAADGVVATITGCGLAVGSPCGAAGCVAGVGAAVEDAFVTMGAG